MVELVAWPEDIAGYGLREIGQLLHGNVGQKQRVSVYVRIPGDFVGFLLGQRAGLRRAHGTGLVLILRDRGMHRASHKDCRSGRSGKPVHCS
ncbi:hypothetical protein D9M69_609730 [compost metagenome]